MKRMHIFMSRAGVRAPKIQLPSATRLAIVAIAFAMTAPAASAAQIDNDQVSQITVQASQKVKTKQVGVSYTGIPIEQIQLTRRVGYGDLDLASSAGKAALDKRIKDTAKAACEQLSTLYPLEQWTTDNQTCIADAIDAAMTQKETILADASKK
jgi:UrcA family protein